MVTKPQDRDQLEERRALLQNRLNDGYQRIEEAEQAGADTAEWESFWIKLLHEYEGVCRELDAPHAISLSSTPADTPCTPHDPMEALQRADQRSLLLGGM